MQIEKPVRFLFATTPSAAARIMHDIAKAVARDQKKTVAARFETLLQVCSQILQQCAMYATIHAKAPVARACARNTTQVAHPWGELEGTRTEPVRLPHVLKSTSSDTSALYTEWSECCALTLCCLSTLATGACADAA